MKVAEHFTKFTDERIQKLIIQPPYESGKEKLNQWVRGSIKYQTSPDALAQDLVITGPKLKICFGGCKWNKLVFGMPSDDPNANEFREWLLKVTKKLKASIVEAPDKYKPGTRTATRFSFEDDVVKPSSDPERYPDELRCRLSTIRRDVSDKDKLDGAPSDNLFDPSVELMEIIDANIFTVNSDGELEGVDATTIKARSHMIPVLRVSYYRHNDKFMLNLTITKGQLFPSDNHYPLQNSEWIIDSPAKEPKANVTEESASKKMKFTDDGVSADGSTALKT
jgi:hypothetical protein